MHKVGESIGGAVSGLPGNGDHNGNGLVTLLDFAHWEGCMLGPLPNSVIAGCEPFDLDADGDVDAIDFGALQLALTDCDDLRTLPSHNCCETGHGAGCTNPTIQACVCEQNALCCGSGAWGSDCVADVDFFGCGTCAIEGDCNTNAIPDACDIAGDTSNDCNENGLPDECDTVGDPPSPVAFDHDACSAPFAVVDGQTAFNTIGATTDGPTVPVTCGAYGETQIGSDVWFVYTATCDGELVVSLCGSSYDTKMAVYAGSACPPLLLEACSDDDCGVGALDSRVTIPVLTGEDYLIRVGGFAGEQGDGTLTIRCGVETCAPCAGACFEANGSPGCEDADCCRTTCGFDAFCCDVEWDDFCAGEAQGLCMGNFDACAAGSGACGEGNGTGGCDNIDCCNTVCLTDPFCCVDTWDAICADEAAALCGLTCGAGKGDCFLPNGSSGCDDLSCCLTICAEDPFCCQTDWDQGCADSAAQVCR